MDNAQSKSSARPQTTTSKEQAHSEKLSENKNISAMCHTSFRTAQTLHIPGLQIMPFSQEGVPGVSQENKASEGTRSPYDMQLQRLRSRITNDTHWTMKIDTIENLLILKRYDPLISVSDTRTLCEAINALDRALAASLSWGAP